MGSAVAATLPQIGDNEQSFDADLLCDALLGQDVQLTTKQAAVEGMSKLPPYLDKYTAKSLPAHLCELLIDNVRTKISLVHDFCVRIADGQLLTMFFMQMRGTDMAQIAGKLQSRHGNPFPLSDWICAVDFNPLTDHAYLDAELLCLYEHFTVKYEESMVLHAMVSSLYNMAYD